MGSERPQKVYSSYIEKCCNILPLVFDLSVMKLTNFKVFITGATSKLGRELTLAFANSGADICINYHSAIKDAEELLGVVQKIGCNACITCDANIELALKEANEKLGGIDLLVNNAAVIRETPLESINDEEWDELLTVNLKRPFFFAKGAVKYLRSSVLGRIINISDTYGVSPSARFIPYGVSKAGVIAMTKGLAKELAPDILVNCICPGVIDDEALKVADRRAVGANLLKRPVKMEDVVSAVMFLSHNDSMTGQVLLVDGGKNV